MRKAYTYEKFLYWFMFIGVSLTNIYWLKTYLELARSLYGIDNYIKIIAAPIFIVLISLEFIFGYIIIKGKMYK